ncbi:MAG TPA: SRPBCC domain-containing protein [Thermomicrobiales bacterium]|nr:SRPBCC domain-containing protein [Thermomicrobiales bacterium]
MEQEDSGTIEREIRVNAEPDTVFEFLTDPEKLVQWMGTTAELEPRPGGKFRLSYDGEHVARGEYMEIDRPRRVVLSWGWEGEGAATQPGASVVTFSLVADGNDTIVRMTHSGLVGDEIASHSAGWDMFLPNLVGAGSGAAPNA